jgi:uncharacterized protein with von Willebrand factor type A (vWA) domain
MAAIDTAPGSTRLAGQLGGVLAAIHGLGVPCGEGAQVDRWYRAAHGAGHWRQLAACAERAGRGWAGRLRAALPLLAEVEALVAARAAEAVPLVVTRPRKHQPELDRRRPELYRDRQLDELDILDANASQLRELRQAIRPLARKLAARMAKRRRGRRRGRVDVRRTLRHSLAYGGVPVHPAFRARKASKPDLYVLADVSGSVIEFARFTLSLLHAMDQQFSKLRSFAFVDGVDEVSKMLDEAGDVLDFQRLFTRAEVVWADGHSNYGNVFATFEERYGADLDGRSTLLIMGDARNNYRDPGLEVLHRLAGRVRHVYWLNPEPQDEWDTTDSIMSTYAPTATRCSRSATCASWSPASTRSPQDDEDSASLQLGWRCRRVIGEPGLPAGELRAPAQLHPWLEHVPLLGQ